MGLSTPLSLTLSPAGRGEIAVKAVVGGSSGTDHPAMRRDPFMTLRAKELRTNQTPAEDRGWSIVRARRLAGLRFRRQHVLGRYTADFVSIRARPFIEIDGEPHGNDEAEVRDAKRTEEIEQAGFSGRPILGRLRLERPGRRGGRDDFGSHSEVRAASPRKSTAGGRGLGRRCAFSTPLSLTLSRQAASGG